jgi:hypothetical protein
MSDSAGANRKVVPSDAGTNDPIHLRGTGLAITDGRPIP